MNKPEGRVAASESPALSPEMRRHGLQMASAVVLAFALSRLAGLPEPLWAVMSALIVMRPNLASSLDAGLGRAGATVLGALCGLLGVGLTQWTQAGGLITVAVVAGLAYFSVSKPDMRSAPVAALVVLSATAVAGHPALQVAGLRVVQVVIGIAVGLLVSLTGSVYRAEDRVRGGCARLLLGAANALGRPVSVAGQDLAGKLSPAANVLGRLAVLAESADKMSRRFRGSRAHPAIAGAGGNARLVALTRRTLQDLAAFNRVAVHGEEQDSQALRTSFAAVLANFAGALQSRGMPDPAMLERFSAASANPPSLMAGSAFLLAQDLRELTQQMQAQ